MREVLIKELLKADFRAIARSITIVENELEGYEELQLQLHQKNTPVIGFTGPPGAGKSTLVNEYIGLLLKENKKVAVIAIDPSSPFNYGALLGDRIRMLENHKNDNLFIRSVATRGSLGGLSEKVIDIVEILKSANFDYIIIETVGVGQSEVDIAGVADITAVVLVPESGDQIQNMKAGLMEIADFFIVNKADREGADNICNSIHQMLMYRKENIQIPVVKTVAIKKDGILEVSQIIESFIKSRIGLNEKKVQLLANKVYRTIQRIKMKNIRMEDIISDIKSNYKQEYNIYKYINSYIKRTI